MCALYKGIEVPDNDAERVRAVESYGILDTAPEVAYDDITELAAQICGCPVSYIGLVDDKRQWLKSKYGLPPDFHERPRELTLCAPTICQNDLLTVPDLSKNERYAELPVVKGPPHARFYCGMPLINPEGYVLGTICAVDLEPKDLTPEQRESMRRLARQVMAQLELRRKVFELDRVRTEMEQAQRQLEAEKARSDNLLLNILPGPIAEELKREERVEPRFYGSATIMFADFKDFTRIVEGMEPKGLVEQLDDYFSLFDDIVERHGLEKLKTVGDQHMSVAGLPRESRSHAVDACLAALEMREAMARVNRNREKLRLEPWPIRIGLHTGPVMAGVVGRRKFTYDIWGDAVNVAARMEQAGEPGRINISESTYSAVARVFDVERRGSVEVKNKGAVAMYFLDGIKAEYALAGDPGRPNETFRAAAGYG